MQEIKAPILFKLFEELNEYSVQAQDATHTIWHVTAGLRGGPDFLEMDPLGISIRWYASMHSSRETDEKKSLLKHLLKNPKDRKKLFTNREKHAPFLKKLYGKRMENLVGFLAWNRLVDAFMGAATTTNASNLNGYADIPFYEDDLCLQQHVAYFNSRLVLPKSKDELFVFKTMTNDYIQNTLSLEIPNDETELNHAIRRTLAYERLDALELNWKTTRPKENAPVSSDDVYHVFYDLKPPTVYKGAHLAFSKEKYHLVSPRPVLYETPFPHFLFGDKIRVFLARLPKETKDFHTLPSLHQRMTEVHRELFDDVYIHNLEKHIERWDKKEPLKINDPYNGKIHQAFLGPHPVLTIPSTSVVAQFSMNTSNFSLIHEENSEKYAHHIKNKFKLV